MTFADIAQELHVTMRIERLDPDAKKFLSVQLGSDRVQDLYFEPTMSFANIVPPEYHDFASVFSKKEASKLLKHISYDHRIPIEKGTSLPTARSTRCHLWS
jgi:hypothetical protein